MKTLLTTCLALFLGSSLVHAETVLSCKKQNAFVSSSFYWVQIEKNPDESLSFQYGIGIDTQMLEVYFNSPVSASADGSYAYQDANYSLLAIVNHSRLSFTLKDSRQSVTRSKFICQ